VTKSPKEAGTNQVWPVVKDLLR